LGGNGTAILSHSHPCLDSSGAVKRGYRAGLVQVVKVSPLWNLGAIIVELTINGHILRLVQGDITALEVEAIVNPANDRLILGGGVAGAIRAKGGQEIQAECDRIGSTPVGTAVMTTGGNLKARYVIHAVGPRWGEGEEEAKLESAVGAALELASRKGLKSIALPAISTGIFGFPLEPAARIMVRTVKKHLLGETALKEVVLCLFGQESYEAFRAAAGEEEAG